MKQPLDHKSLARQERFAVIVLFALIIASSLTSIGSYTSTSRLVNEDIPVTIAFSDENRDL